MPRKGLSSEQIVAKLRQIEVMTSQYKTVGRRVDFVAERLSLAQGIWRIAEQARRLKLA